MLAPLVLAALTATAPAVRGLVPEPPYLVCVVLVGATVPVPDSFHDTEDAAKARRRQIVTEGWIVAAENGSEEEYGPAQIRRAVLGLSEDQTFCAPPQAHSQRRPRDSRR